MILPSLHNQTHTNLWGNGHIGQPAHGFIDTSMKIQDTSLIRTIAGHVNPQNPLGKIGTLYPQPMLYDAIFGVLRIAITIKHKIRSYLINNGLTKEQWNTENQKGALTVECHKLLNGLYFKYLNHESSSATLAPRSLFRVGKILIYVNACHKSHFLVIMNKLKVAAERTCKKLMKWNWFEKKNLTL